MHLQYGFKREREECIPLYLANTIKEKRLLFYPENRHSLNVRLLDYSVFH